MYETITDVSHYLLTELAVLLIVNISLWLWVWCIPTRVFQVPRLYVGAHGLALPGVILLTRQAYLEKVLRHELAHQKQMRRYSPLGASFLLGYYYSQAFLRARLKTGAWPTFLSLWHTNPLEIEANEAMHSTQPLPKVTGWTQQ